MKTLKNASLPFLVALLCALLAVVSCSAQDGSAQQAPSIGTMPIRITFHVDPKAERAMTVVGLRAMTGAVVTASALFTSTASWNPTTHVLSSTVYIQSLDTANNWDEPSMVVTSISSMSTTAVIQFQEVNAGTFTGSGGAGSAYAFADIQKSGSTPDWSLQKIQVYDPDDVPFNFTVDLLATETAGAVNPDRDHDGWNSEAGAAGGDCDDNDASKYPGGGTCACGTTAASCGACAATDNCCVITGGHNAAGCGPGCSCTESLSGNTFSVVSCGAGSTCAFTVSGKHHSTIGACNAGASCSMTCTSANSSCQIASCDGADCSITAAGKTGGVAISECKNGATCHINCAKDSTCSLTCSDSSSSCSISNCAGIGAGSCTLSCPSGFLTACADGSFTCGSC